MKLCLACEKPFSGADWICPHCGWSPAVRGGFPAFAPELAEQNAGFNPEFFRLMAEVEPSHFWFVARNHILGDVLRKRVPAPAQVLEIGCGTGFALSGMRAVFPEARFSASDIYTDGLGFAARRVPGAFLFQMDACRIPFREEFDLIGAFDVIEHIEDDEAALAQLYQACKPGGRVLLTVPQHRWLWSRVDEFAHHQRRYTRPELLAKLSRAGLRVEYATSFVTLLLPAMWAGRLGRKRADAAQDQMDAAGLGIGKFANALLSAVMAFERLLIRAGIRFPAGGSLLVLASKPTQAGKAD